MTMRDFLNIVEGAEDDVNMDKMATRACRMLMRHAYEHGEADFEVEFGKNAAGLSTYLCFKPETIGFDKEFGIDQLLICIGEKNPRAIGLSGMYAKFDKIIMGRYTGAIIVNCLNAINNVELKKALNSTRFIPVFKHEFIHALDDLRTKEKIKKHINAKEPEKYYNSDSEFNAYYHNVADEILHMINEIREHGYTAEEAQEVADLYGISSDFAKTIKNSIGTDSSTREFYKWLTDDRRKALLKRLYKAHQVLLGLMETGATPAS